jgi:ADP-heptose:LPS heptosyltransferase
MGQAYSILIVAFDALGDFVLSTPAMKWIKDSFPGSSVEVICSFRNGDLAEAYGYFDRVHRIQLNGELRDEEQVLLSRLRERNFDFIINLFDEPDEFAIVKILSLLKNTNQLISLPLHFKSKEQQRLLRRQHYFLPDTSSLVLPFARRIFAIAEILGARPPNEIRYEFPAFEQTNKLQSSEKLKVLLNTAGSQRANTLGRDEIKKVAQMISRQRKLECYIFEDARNSAVKEFLPDVKVLASKSIIEAGSYVKQMDLVVTTDTVTAHLATCYEVPVLVMRVNLPYKAAFDPVYGVNEVVVSKTAKLKDLDFERLSKSFEKMAGEVRAIK